MSAAASMQGPIRIVGYFHKKWRRTLCPHWSVGRLSLHSLCFYAAIKPVIALRLSEITLQSTMDTEGIKLFFFQFQAADVDLLSSNTRSSWQAPHMMMKMMMMLRLWTWVVLIAGLGCHRISTVEGFVGRVGGRALGGFNDPDCAVGITIWRTK